MLCSYYFFFPLPIKYPASKLGKTKIAIAGPVFESFFGVGVCEPDDEDLFEFDEVDVLLDVLFVGVVGGGVVLGGVVVDGVVFGGVVVVVVVLLLDELPPRDGGEESVDVELELLDELPESPNGEDTLGGASAYDTATLVMSEIINDDSRICFVFIGIGYIRINFRRFDLPE